MAEDREHAGEDRLIDSIDHRPLTLQPPHDRLGRGQSDGVHLLLLCRANRRQPDDGVTTRTTTCITPPPPASGRRRARPATSEPRQWSASEHLDSGPTRVSCCVGVTGDHRIQDGVMAGDHVVPPHERPAVGIDAFHMVEVLGHHLPIDRREAGVPGQIDQRLMEGEVVLPRGCVVTFEPRHLGQTELLCEGAKLDLRNTIGHRAHLNGRERLDCLPDAEDLLEIDRRRRPDDGPVSPCADHDAAALQRHQRLAHRATAHAQARRQIGGHEVGARCQFARQDRRANTVGDLFPQVALLDRLQVSFRHRPRASVRTLRPSPTIASKVGRLAQFRSSTLVQKARIATDRHEVEPILGGQVCGLTRGDGDAGELAVAHRCLADRRREHHRIPRRPPHVPSTAYKLAITGPAAHADRHVVGSNEHPVDARGGEYLIETIHRRRRTRSSGSTAPARWPRRCRLRTAPGYGPKLRIPRGGYRHETAAFRASAALSMYGKMTPSAPASRAR